MRPAVQSTSAPFLAGVFFLCAACAEEGASPRSRRPKAPFEVLYSNDFTNTSCVSPFNARSDRSGWSPAKLRATVDETAGLCVDVHLLQPGHCWLPWWPSKVYPMEEHYRWWRKRFGYAPSRPVHEYIRQGGDPLRVFVDQCRLRGQRPFISFRLNDGHHLENAFADAKKARRGRHTICQFYVENPQYILGAEPAQTYSRVKLLQNWAIKDVRDYKFRLIQEVCENCDLDGIELDYLRHHGYFRQDQTTSQQRADIMTGFVKRVRTLLGRTARPGSYRWLCVRVPCYTAFFDPLGIDLPRLAEAGVDMVNVSASYFTIQQNDMARIRSMVPSKAVYLEMCHTTRLGPAGARRRYDRNTYRRTTLHQYQTAAHLAYARGLDGVSLFNFVYYREHGDRDRGPFHEPPFEAVPHLSDRAWLARQPQHYIWRVNKMTKVGGTRSPRLQNAQFPETFSAGHTATWPVDMAPPEGGWQTGGVLRIQSDKPLGTTTWQARLNGKALAPSADVSEPYPTPYPSLLGTPEQHRAWTVPRAILRDGRNRVEVTMVSGQPNKKVVFVDISIR